MATLISIGLRSIQQENMTMNNIVELWNDGVDIYDIADILDMDVNDVYSVLNHAVGEGLDTGENDYE
jgi:hypothetical protein